MKILNNKGVTLIELLISTAIIMIVITVIFTFFLSNYKADNSVNDEIELQSQGERAINFIADNIIDSYGIEAAEDDSYNDILDNNLSYNVSKFAVKRKENGTDSDYYSIFQFKNDKLYYLKSTDADDEADNDISTYIENINLTPRPSDCSFKNAKGIKITLTLKLNDSTKTLTTEVYFRNK